MTKRELHIRELTPSFTVSVVVLLLVALLLTCKHSDSLREDLAEKEKLLSSLNETVKTWKDKKGLSHSKREVIETSDVNTFLKLKNLSEENKELQGLVANYKNKLKNKGSVTRVEKVTRYDTVFKTNVVYSRDSFRTLSKLDSINNNYIFSRFGFQDSLTIFSLVVKDRYSVIIGEEKDGWFKRKTFVEVINDNPYSETKKVKTYAVDKRDNRKIGIGTFIGYGFTNELKPTFIGGVGINYNFIRF